MRRLNIIGPTVARLRFERGWTQETLAARLQCLGVDISRQKLANMESGRTQVPDALIPEFQKAFAVPVILFFPKVVRDLDVKFAQRASLKSAPKPALNQTLNQL